MTNFKSEGHRLGKVRPRPMDSGSLSKPTNYNNHSLNHGRIMSSNSNGNGNSNSNGNVSNFQSHNHNNARSRNPVFVSSRRSKEDEDEEEPWDQRSASRQNPLISAVSDGEGTVTTRDSESSGKNSVLEEGPDDEMNPSMNDTRACNVLAPLYNATYICDLRGRAASPGRARSPVANRSLDVSEDGLEDGELPTLRRVESPPPMSQSHSGEGSIQLPAPALDKMEMMKARSFWSQLEVADLSPVSSGDHGEDTGAAQATVEAAAAKVAETKEERQQKGENDDEEEEEVTVENEEAHQRQLEKEREEERKRRRKLQREMRQNDSSSQRGSRRRRARVEKDRGDNVSIADSFMAMLGVVRSKSPEKEDARSRDICTMAQEVTEDLAQTFCPADDEDDRPRRASMRKTRLRYQSYSDLEDDDDEGVAIEVEYVEEELSIATFDEMDDETTAAGSFIQLSPDGNVRRVTERARSPPPRVFITNMPSQELAPPPEAKEETEEDAEEKRQQAKSRYLETLSKRAKEQYEKKNAQNVQNVQNGKQEDVVEKDEVANLVKRGYSKEVAKGIAEDRQQALEARNDNDNDNNGNDDDNDNDGNDHDSMDLSTLMDHLGSDTEADETGGVLSDPGGSSGQGRFLRHKFRRRRAPLDGDDVSVSSRGSAASFRSTASALSEKGRSVLKKFLKKRTSAPTKEESSPKKKESPKKEGLSKKEIKALRAEKERKEKKRDDDKVSSYREVTPPPPPPPPPLVVKSKSKEKSKERRRRKEVEGSASVDDAVSLDLFAASTAKPQATLLEVVDRPIPGLTDLLAERSYDDRWGSVFAPESPERADTKSDVYFPSGTSPGANNDDDDDDNDDDGDYSVVSGRSFRKPKYASLNGTENTSASTSTSLPLTSTLRSVKDKVSVPSAIKQTLAAQQLKLKKFREVDGGLLHSEDAEDDEDEDENEKDVPTEARNPLWDDDDDVPEVYTEELPPPPTPTRVRIADLSELDDLVSQAHSRHDDSSGYQPTPTHANTHSQSHQSLHQSLQQKLQQPLHEQQQHSQPISSQVQPNDAASVVSDITDLSRSWVTQPTHHSHVPSTQIPTIQSLESYDDEKVSPEPLAKKKVTLSLGQYLDQQNVREEPVETKSIHDYKSLGTQSVASALGARSILTTNTESTWRRRNGASKARLEHAKQTKSGSGWLESMVEVQSTVTDHTWDADHGWVEKTAPTTKTTTTTTTTDPPTTTTTDDAEIEPLFPLVGPSMSSGSAPDRLSETEQLLRNPSVSHPVKNQGQGPHHPPKRSEGKDTGSVYKSELFNDDETEPPVELTKSLSRGSSVYKEDFFKEMRDHDDDEEEDNDDDDNDEDRSSSHRRFSFGSHSHQSAKSQSVYNADFFELTDAPNPATMQVPLPLYDPKAKGNVPTKLLQKTRRLTEKTKGFVKKSVLSRSSSSHSLDSLTSRPKYSFVPKDDDDDDDDNDPVEDNDNVDPPFGNDEVPDEKEPDDWVRSFRPFVDPDTLRPSSRYRSLKEDEADLTALPSHDKDKDKSLSRPHPSLASSSEGSFNFKPLSDPDAPTPRTEHKTFERGRPKERAPAPAPSKPPKELHEPQSESTHKNRTTEPKVTVPDFATFDRDFDVDVDLNDTREPTTESIPKHTSLVLSTSSTTDEGYHNYSLGSSFSTRNASMETESPLEPSHRPAPIRIPSHTPSEPSPAVVTPLSTSSVDRTASSKGNLRPPPDPPTRPRPRWTLSATSEPDPLTFNGDPDPSQPQAQARPLPEDLDVTKEPLKTPKPPTLSHERVNATVQVIKQKCSAEDERLFAPDKNSQDDEDDSFEGFDPPAFGTPQLNTPTTFVSTKNANEEAPTNTDGLPPVPKSHHAPVPTTLVKSTLTATAAATATVAPLSPSHKTATDLSSLDVETTASFEKKPAKNHPTKSSPSQPQPPPTDKFAFEISSTASFEKKSTVPKQQPQAMPQAETEKCAFEISSTASFEKNSKLHKSPERHDRGDPASNGTTNTNHPQEDHDHKDSPAVISPKPDDGTREAPKLTKKEKKNKNGPKKKKKGKKTESSTSKSDIDDGEAPAEPNRPESESTRYSSPRKKNEVKKDRTKRRTSFTEEKPLITHAVSEEEDSLFLDSLARTLTNDGKERKSKQPTTHRDPLETSVSGRATVQLGGHNLLFEEAQHPDVKPVKKPSSGGTERDRDTYARSIAELKGHLAPPLTTTNPKAPTHISEPVESKANSLLASDVDKRHGWREVDTDVGAHSGSGCHNEFLARMAACAGVGKGASARHEDVPLAHLAFLKKRERATSDGSKGDTPRCLDSGPVLLCANGGKNPRASPPAQSLNFEYSRSSTGSYSHSQSHSRSQSHSPSPDESSTLWYPSGSEKALGSDRYPRSESNAHPSTARSKSGTGTSQTQYLEHIAMKAAVSSFQTAKLPHRAGPAASPKTKTSSEAWKAFLAKKHAKTDGNGHGPVSKAAEQFASDRVEEMMSALSSHHHTPATSKQKVEEMIDKISNSGSSHVSRKHAQTFMHKRELALRLHKNKNHNGHKAGAEQRAAARVEAMMSAMAHTDTPSHSNEI